jgi:hypothetical protein
MPSGRHQPPRDRATRSMTGRRLALYSSNRWPRQMSASVGTLKAADGEGSAVSWVGTIAATRRRAECSEPLLVSRLRVRVDVNGEGCRNGHP